jgi:hypothetical protein
MAIPSQKDSAYRAALERSRAPIAIVEENTRRLCERFGVDPNLPSETRAKALARAIAKAGGIGGGHRRVVRERVPGEDDE